MMSKPPDVQSMETKTVRGGEQGLHEINENGGWRQHDDPTRVKCEDIWATDHNGHLTAHPTPRLQHAHTSWGGLAFG